MLSLNGKIISRLLNKDWDAVFLVIESREWGINDYIFNEDGSAFTLLESAVEMKMQDIVKRLTSMGADVNKIGVQMTPLMRACESRQVEMVSLLLKAEADVNISTKKIKGEDSGKTALMFAAERNDIEIVIRLLTAGADFTCASARGCTALTAASERGGKELMQLLIEAGCPLTGTELHNPIYRREIELVKYLLDAGSDVNAPYPNNDSPGIFKGDAPILVAVRRNNDELVAAMGLKVPIKSKEKLSIIKELIAKGAVVNTVGSKKYPPLSEAIINEELEVVRVLLAAEADPNFGPHKPGSGKTTLEIAKSKKLVGIVKLLENVAATK